MQDRNFQYYLNQKAIAAHYVELGNMTKALEHYNNAYLTPYGSQDLDLMLDLAYMFDELDDKDTALDIFSNMMKIEPDFPTSYYGMATLYDDNEEYEKAIYYYQKTIELDPQYEAAHFFLANIYDTLGETELAIQHYEKTIDIDPNYYYAYVNLGCIYEELDVNLKAYHYFYQAYKIDSSDYMAIFNLGVACRKLKMVKESIRYYERSLQSNVEYANTYLNLAILYKEEFQDYEKSIELYTTGIHYNKEQSVLYYNRACCYALLNQYDKALQDLDVATNLSISLLEYMETDDELNVLHDMSQYQELFNKRGC